MWWEKPWQSVFPVSKTLIFRWKQVVAGAEGISKDTGKLTCPLMTAVAALWPNFFLSIWFCVWPLGSLPASVTCDLRAQRTSLVLSLQRECIKGRMESVLANMTVLSYAN